MAYVNGGCGLPVAVDRHRGLVYIYKIHLSVSSFKQVDAKDYQAHWPKAALSASSEATAATLSNKDTKPGQKRGNPVPWQKDHGLTDALLALLRRSLCALLFVDLQVGAARPMAGI